MRRESNTIIQSLGQDMNGVSDSNTSRPLYRPRQLEKEMRLLAKKEAAARNEKTDMLRSEIANTALTKQRLMQDAMERRKRRTGKRRNRSISMDSDTESAYEEDSILSVNSHHSNSDGKMLTIMENANDVKVINTQHQNTSHKLNVTSALVAKFESSQLTKKNQLNQQEKVPLTITTSTTINTKTEEPKNQHKPPVKNGVALLIAKYDTTKNTPSTSTTSTNVSNTVNKSVINTTKLPFIPNTTDILMDKSIASNSSNLTVTPLLENDIEVNDLLDSYFCNGTDSEDDSISSNNEDTIHMNKLLDRHKHSNEQQEGEELNSPDTQHSPHSSSSESARVRDELRMLEEAEEHLRETHEVTQRLLTLTRRLPIFVLDEPKLSQASLSLDNSILSLSSFYDPDLISHHGNIDGNSNSDGSIAVYDVRKSINCDFGSNDVMDLKLPERIPHALTSSGHWQNDVIMKRSQLHSFDRRSSLVIPKSSSSSSLSSIATTTSTTSTMTPVTAFKSELNLLMNGLFTSSNISPSTFIPTLYPLRRTVSPHHRTISVTTAISNRSNTLLSISSHSINSSISEDLSSASLSQISTMDSNHSSLITSPVNSNDITLGGLLQQVDLKCTSELVESTKSDMDTVDESPSSVRRQSSMASRVKSRRQRRNSGVLGVADTLRSKRSSFNAKLDTHSANSTELSSNPVIAVEKPVVDELREIICERLSEAFLDKAVENTSERISINDTIQNSELYQLAINDTDTPLSTPSTAGIRIISVQGQKARIVFNKKPAPPPGQRPLMDNMRSTRMASIGELHHYHQQSTSNAQSTSSLYDGREVPFRHSRSASVPIVDSQHLSGTTLPREFNDQPTQLTLQSSIVNTASTKFNVTLKQRKTHRKSSSLSMAYPTFNKMSMGDNTVSCKNIPQVVIPPTSSQAMAVSRHPPLMVNTSKVNMQKSSLKASTSAIKNASNTSNSNSNSSYHLKLPESTFSSVQSSSRHCTTTNTTNMTSNTHNNTALHTRTTSDPAINKTLVVNHQRSHSQPAIHEVSLADQSLSHQANKTLTHRISTLRNAMLTGTPLDDTSSDTVDALSLHMNTTTLSMLSNVNDKKTPLSPVTEYPQIDWEKLPPWNQVYWNEHPSISLDNNITSNINNDSLNVNKNATQGTHSNTLCDNNNNNSSVLSIDQQLKDASIPMASSMNTMLNNAASITGTTTATATAIATATASTSQPPNNYYNAYLARTCHFGVQGSYQASYNSLSQHVNSTSVSNQISNESEQQKMFNHKSSPLLILITYLKHFDFAETSIDLALRALLLDIPLPRQPEKVDCILIAFSNRFHECNPDMFPSIDVVYSTAFSILLLHADMHGSDAHQCINFEQFINQVNSTDKTQFVASEFLEIIYDNIVTTKLSHAGEQQINQRNNGDTNIDNHGNILGRFLGRNRTNSNSVKSPQRYMQQANKGKLKPQLTIPKADQYSFTPNNSKPSNTQSISQSACFLRISGIKPSLASSIGNHPTEYSLSLLPSHSMPGSEQNSHVQLLCSKQDLVIRKLDQIESGHRSGQRSWVHYWLALCGSQLFLFPDVAWFRDPNHQSILPMAGSVLTDPYQHPVPPPIEICSLKDAICIIDHSYTKYPYVLRLCLPDGQQWLLRTGSEEAITDWMFKINHVAIYRSIKLTPAPCVQATPEELVQRRTIINNQLHSIASQLAKLKLKIDADTRLFLQLSMSVPIRRKVRDRAITTGRVLSTRLSQEYIEQQRLICYQEMLKFELQSMLIKR